MTKEQAIALYATEFWKQMSAHNRAKFQLFENRLCMPFAVFHEAVECCLGRPVFTHEFGLNIDGLKREFLGGIAAPSFDEIVNLIPSDKRIVIIAPEENGDECSDG